MLPRWNIELNCITEIGPPLPAAQVRWIRLLLQHHLFALLKSGNHFRLYAIRNPDR